jgi:hypothetical protein
LLACCGPIIEDLEVSQGDFVARVERVECETRPALELGQLAGGADAPAVLARLILELEDDASHAHAAAALVNEALSRINDVWRARSYQPIAQDIEPDAVHARRTLSRQAYLLLDELVAQRESAADEGGVPA